MVKSFESFYREQYERNKKISYKEAVRRYRQENGRISNEKAAEIARRVKGVEKDIKKITRKPGQGRQPKQPTRQSTKSGSPKPKSSRRTKDETRRDLEAFFKRYPEMKNRPNREVRKAYREIWGGKASNEMIDSTKRDVFDIPFADIKSTKMKYKKFEMKGGKKYLIQERYVYVVRYHVRHDENDNDVQQRIFTLGSNRKLTKNEVIDYLFMQFDEYERKTGGIYLGYHIAEDMPIKIIGKYDRGQAKS